jgi:hypothetical protein
MSAENITLTMTPRESATIQAALELWTLWHSPTMNHHPLLLEQMKQRLALFAPDPLTDDEITALQFRVNGDE